MQICAAYKPALIYGGPTMSVSMLSEQLAMAGCDTEVYATTANGQAELPVIPGEQVLVDGVRVTYFKRLTKDHTHFSPSLLIKLWKGAPGFDLVHIHAWWNLVSLGACAIAFIRRVPVLLSPRGTLSPYSFNNRNIGPKWLLHKFFAKYLLNRCYMHVTSAREQQAVLTLVNPQSVHLIPNFVKLATLPATTQKIRETRIRLIFLSRIEEKKGLDLLINGLPAVTAPWQLTIAGDGDKAYIDLLKSLAEKNRVNDRINWVGFSYENKFELLRQHDLFVLPSHDENFGNTVIESLSAGTAVLISEQVGLADYVFDNQFGWICKTDALSIAAAINNVANNRRNDLDRIRATAPANIIKDFDESTLVNKYINLYRELIKNE